MRRSWLALLTITCLASPVHAQIGGQPIELSGQAGWFKPDTRDRLEAGLAFGGSLGYRMQPWLVLEGHALFAPGESEVVEKDVNFSTYGLDLRLNFRPAEGRAVPYALLGFGYGVSHDETVEPAKLERGAPSLGLGLLVNAFGPRSYLRFQARDVFFRGRDAQEFSNHFALTAGLHYLWGGKPRDSDLDGVRDWLDRCPGTPIGAKVDANGCPTDADADSVWDGIDQCPDTPRGAKVDARGCPSDADGDGVFDGIDQCADTPKGASVDATGCPNDEDGDGVVKGVDQCEGTPKGCQVDERGCNKDADNDGVCDGLDQCPDTGPGLKVDTQGCPVEVMDRETELMDTGMIRLQNVNFETAKADILPESLPTLDVVGQVLTKWPELRIEVGGHTDARGSNAYNQRLSEARANSVLNYLKGKFPALKADQFTAKGYGELKPIATNRTVEGMARNRRVEFVVLNKDVLRRETERRRLLQKSEPTPAPTPAPADTTQR